MKVFITGGGGFLGTFIVRKLIERNYEVISYSRSSYSHLEEMGVKCFQGDMSDFTALSEAMKGCEVCFHVASKIAMWGRFEDFYRTNVTGTENILKACRVNGINKFIHSPHDSLSEQGHQVLTTIKTAVIIIFRRSFCLLQNGL